MAYEEPIPKGEHVFTVLKAEERPNDKVKDTTNIFVQLAVSEGQYEGRQVVRTFSPYKNNGDPNPVGRGLIRSFFVAMGLVAEDEQGDVEISQELLDSLTGLAVIAKGRITDFAGPPQWEPVSFKMHDSVKGNATTAAEAPAPEPEPAPAPTPPAKTAAAPAKTAAKPATPAKPATGAARKSI